MDPQIEKPVDIETGASDASDMADNKNSEQIRNETHVTIPNDLFTLNDQVDVAQQLDQDVMDTSMEEEAEEGNDDLLNDEDIDSAQTNNDADAMDFMESTLDDTLGDDVDSNNQIDSDNNEVNFLGEVMEESILDSSARIGLDTDETHQNAPINDDDDFQQQQQQQQEGNDEEDEMVEKTWDMAGDDVDDDQENSSVDALLDAGESSFDSDNNIDQVINDDSFVVDELADTMVDNETSPSSTTGDIDSQRNWSNENGDSISSDNDSNLQEDGSQQSWNEDDDTEAEAEEEQEETMEQGTVEENENDRLGATLENALDALELEQDTPSSPLTPPSPDSVDSGNDIVVDDKTNANNLYDTNVDTTSLQYDDVVDKSAPVISLLPPQQQQQQHGSQEQTTSLGLDNVDDPASVDTSLILLIAVFILLCLRLPYVKRFFVKLFKTQESATLPYHVAHRKELD